MACFACANLYNLFFLSVNLTVPIERCLPCQASHSFDTRSHLRNLPWECTEDELIELGKPFGTVANTKCNVCM